MRKMNILLLVLFCLISNLFSQVTQEWVARYPGAGSGNDRANSIAVDVFGNVYVTGLSYGNGTGMDYTTIKYNSSGVQQWVQKYNGPENSWDEALSIAVDASGNVYVTGESIGIGTNYDYATIKYNSSGVQQWLLRYNGPQNYNDEAFSIAIDASGNVYVTGKSTGIGTSYDYATIKYNTSGVQQWLTRYNGPGNYNDEAYSLALDNSGNVYITGASEGSGTYSDFTTIKYNSSGVQQWLQRYNGPGNNNDYAYSIVTDGSGNVYVTGGSIGSGTAYDYTTIKYNSSGLQQWISRYNGPGNNSDYANSITLDGTGNIYVTGVSWGSGTDFDYATIKYNPSGVQQWLQRYNGPGNNSDYANSIAVDGSGNIYVTGQSFGNGTGADYATIKYNSSGVQQWLQRYTNINFDVAISIVVDGSGNVCVTGGSETESGYDFVTIKYSQQIGIKPISSELPSKFSLSQNYPNPFNPSTIIRFDIPKDSPRLNRGESDNVVLKIYDVLGNEVSTLINEQLKPGTYEILWDGSNFSSGVYYYILQTESFIDTKRMVLVK